MQITAGMYEWKKVPSIDGADWSVRTAGKQTQLWHFGELSQTYQSKTEKEAKDLHNELVRQERLLVEKERERTEMPEGWDTGY